MNKHVKNFKKFVNENYDSSFYDEENIESDFNANISDTWSDFGYDETEKELIDVSIDNIVFEKRSFENNKFIGIVDWNFSYDNDSSYKDKNNQFVYNTTGYFTMENLGDSKKIFNKQIDLIKQALSEKYKEEFIFLNENYFNEHERLSK